MLWPGNQRVGWEELQIPGNLVTTRLAEIEARSQEVYGVVIVRPGSQKFYRLLRSAASKAKIDWSCEPLEDDVVMEWDESQQGLVFKISTGAIKGTSPFKPTPLDVQANKTPVFFECRNHEVFYVNKDEFDSQVAKKLSQINPSVRSGDLSRFLKELQREEIGDANYRVDPKHLLVGVMALELKPDAKGENLQQVLSRNDQFQTLLRLLDKKNDYIAFLVRDDSFEVFRTARWVARQLGYQTGWESLREGEPIKFEIGRAHV